MLWSHWLLYVAIISSSGSSYVFCGALQPIASVASVRISPFISRTHFCSSPRYGPVDMEEEEEARPTTASLELSNHKKESFRNLLDGVLAVKDPQHIPSLLAKRMEVVLSFTTEEGATIVESVLEDIISENPNAETVATVLEAVDIILTFAEEFVQRTANLEQQNKQLLGKILKVMSSSQQESVSALSREETLNELMRREKKNFTPGFLRHLDMECQRIASAAVLTRESTRLLEILRIIQTRVLEEIGSDLGEAAQVLGQIIGYDSSTERLAVLQAGLTVRGTPFALELHDLTVEALEGFQKVVGGADPELIARVQEIDDCLRKHIQQNTVGFE
jgi:hypothetical protein